MGKISNTLKEVLSEFEKLSGLSGIDYEIVNKQSGEMLVIKISFPTERHFELLEQARACHLNKEGIEPLATLKATTSKEILKTPETQLLLRVLSESQNVNRFTFEKDFFNRYTKSVSGAELTVTAEANHVVLCQPSAGK